MRMAIVGVGGVGGYFGARLAQSGEDVAFIARGTHLARALAALDAAPADGTTSMQRDIESGRPSELEAQTGAIARMGKSHGVATPLNDALYQSLLPQERRARGELEF